jgi:hypothetical protein
MKPAAIFLLLAGWLAACADTPQPRITEIGDSSLRVEAMAEHSTREINERAREGCRNYGKQAAWVDAQCLDDRCTRKSHLFACK